MGNIRIYGEMINVKNIHDNGTWWEVRNGEDVVACGNGTPVLMATTTEHMVFEVDGIHIHISH